MLAQLSNNALIIGIVGLIIAVNGSTIALFWRYVSKMKDKIQYKDVCIEIHKGLTKLSDERHKDIKEDLKDIKNLIRNNGKPPLRVQT